MDTAFFEPLTIALKVLTHTRQDLLRSKSRPVFLVSVILGPLDSLIPMILEFAQKSFPSQHLLPLNGFERISISPISPSSTHRRYSKAFQRRPVRTPRPLESVHCRGTISFSPTQRNPGSCSRAVEFPRKRSESDGSRKVTRRYAKSWPGSGTDCGVKNPFACLCVPLRDAYGACTTDLSFGKFSSLRNHL